MYMLKNCFEFLVADGNDNATFVVFDRELLKLTTQDAAGLTLDEVCNFLSHHLLIAALCHRRSELALPLLQLQINDGGREELPQCLTDLAAKILWSRYVWHRLVFTPSHRTFTVSAIIDNIAPERYCNFYSYEPSHGRITQVKLFGRLSRPVKLNSFNWKIRSEDN